MNSFVLKPIYTPNVLWVTSHTKAMRAWTLLISPKFIPPK